MWFLPLLVVGAIAMAIAKRYPSRKALPPGPQQFLPAPGPRPVVAGGPGIPGPIAVMGELLRVGQRPPPTVLLCAVAEAQSIGRHDLASDIVQVFIVPMVRQAQGMRGSCAPIDIYQRGSCAPTRSPRETSNTYSPYIAPAPVTSSSIPSMNTQNAVNASAPAPTITPSMTSMDDEIAALLDADPARFMDMVKNGSLPTMQRPQQQQQQAVPAPTAAPAEPPPTMSVGQSIDFASAEQQPMMAPPVMDQREPGSPFANIPDGAWLDFVRRLARETPQFASSRHVGQYRHRRERLAELNIDPNRIATSPHAQRSALDADLVDAHRHGVASDLFSQHVGRPVSVPGRERPEIITLSGALGVIQCAGLEGAVGWLERSNDRKRYPHTTQAFLSTNNLF